MKDYVLNVLSFMFTSGLKWITYYYSLLIILEKLFVPSITAESTWHFLPGFIFAMVRLDKQWNITFSFSLYVSVVTDDIMSIIIKLLFDVEESTGNTESA